MAIRGPTREEISQTISVSRDALQGLYRSRLPQMAAALSYRTIFGLIPALVVALVVLKAFATTEDITQILERALHYTGISQIVIDEEAKDSSTDSNLLGLDDQDPVPPDDPPSPDDQSSPTEVTDSDQPADSEQSTESSASADRLDEWIEERVTSISSLNLRTIGIIGLGVLIYAAISMLTEIERAFNQVYHARSGRPWSKRILQYWTTLTLGAVALLGSFYLGESFRSWISNLTSANGVTTGGAALTVVGFFTTVIISMILLMFLYTTMPHTRVQKSSAIAGAFVAAVLWEMGKWGFTRYISYSASFERLYGQMALVPLFLLWIYLTWIIVLFGLKVSFGLQHFSEFRATADDDEVDQAEFVDPLSVVSIVSAVSRAFAGGSTLRLSEVSEETGLPPEATQRLLDALAEAEVLHVVAGAEPTYALARPADQIDAADLVAIGQRMVSEPAHDRTRGFYEELQARTRQLVAGRTVASLAAQETEDDSSTHSSDGDPAPGDR